MAKGEISIEKSTTSDFVNTEGKDCILGRFITEAEGWKIVEAAKAWEGTPYRLVGANSVKHVGGDCSGTTNKSYVAAGFPYPYQSTANFAAYVRKSIRFRKIIPANQALQAGDILLWPGHMAIYAPFPENDFRRDTGVVLRGERVVNNMYTAFNTHSDKGYGPYNIQTFRRDSYTAYRYLVISGLESCAK